MALIKIPKYSWGQSCCLGNGPTWHHLGRSCSLSTPREGFQSITGPSRKKKGLEGTWKSWYLAISELFVSEEA